MNVNVPEIDHHLKSSYPNNTIESFLQCLSELWFEDPIALLRQPLDQQTRQLTQGPNYDEMRINGILWQLKDSDLIERLLGRLFAVACCKLYPRDYNTSALAANIQQKLAPNIDVEVISDKLRQCRQRGNRWQKLVHWGGAGMGTILLLSGAHQWDHASESQCKAALLHLQTRSNFQKRARKFAAPMDRILQRILEGSETTSVIAKPRDDGNTDSGCQIFNYALGQAISLDYGLKCVAKMESRIYRVPSFVHPSFSELLEAQTAAHYNSRFQYALEDLTAPPSELVAQPIHPGDVGNKTTNWSFLYEAVHDSDFDTLSVLIPKSLAVVDEFDTGLLSYAAEYTLKSKGQYAAVATYCYLLHNGCPQIASNFQSHPVFTLLDGVYYSSGTKEMKRSCLHALADAHGLTEEYLAGLYTFIRQSQAPHAWLAGDSLPFDASEIDVVDALGRSALSLAVEYGNIPATKQLIRFGADVNQIRHMSSGWTPLLHLAIACPRSILGATARERRALIRLLVTNGANPWAVDSDHWTPEHVAASWGLKDIKAWLYRQSLRSDIDIVSNKTSSNMTPDDLLNRFESYKASRRSIDATSSQ